MKKAIQIFCAVALMVFLPLGGNASSFGTTTTYSNILWTVSTTIPDFAGCTELRLDGTGDMQHSFSFGLYGALNCPALGGGYGAVGSGYGDVEGRFNLNLIIGAGVSLVCPRMVSLSGACVVTNSSGVRVGTAYITFLG